MKNDFSIYKKWCKQNNLKEGRHTTLKHYMTLDIVEDENGELHDDSTLELYHSDALGGYLNARDEDSPKAVYHYVN